MPPGQHGQRYRADADGCVRAAAVRLGCWWPAVPLRVRYHTPSCQKELWLYYAVAEEWRLEQWLEEMLYGEGQTDDKDHNLRGQLYQTKDGAGIVTVPDYDFKGNPLGSARQYTADPRRHPYWQTPVAMEEDGSGNPVLYTMSTVYDALSRPVTITTPEGGETQHTYNKTGLLQATDISGVHGLSDEVVLDTKYDAKSQRKKEQYGNGTTSTYEYDPSTLRVTRIRTTRHSDSKELQDLRYWYDPVGNVTLLKDLAQQEVYFANTVVSADRDCTYDALYRLIREEGRELIGNDGATSCNDGSRSGKTPIPFVNTVPPPSDAKALRRYTEHYSYDAVGNMTELDHDTGGTGSWTRTFTISSTSNHLTGCSIGSNDPLSETYNYDNRGNLVSGMNHFIAMNYNAENRLEEVMSGSPKITDLKV